MITISENDKIKLKIVYFIKQIFEIMPDIKKIDIVLTHHEKTDISNNILEQSIFLDQIFYIDLKKHFQSLGITQNAMINDIKKIKILNNSKELEELSLVNWKSIDIWKQNYQTINSFKLVDINNNYKNYNVFYKKYIQNSFINNKHFFLNWLKQNNTSYYNTKTTFEFVNGDNSYIENFLGKELIAYCEKMFLSYKNPYNEKNLKMKK